MKLPVFVSTPSNLSPEQTRVKLLILDALVGCELEPHTVSNYIDPEIVPLREVAVLARSCAGGVILGFEQLFTPSGFFKRGTALEQQFSEPVRLPTPWNHLEAGVLYGMGMSLLVFHEQGISGGIFDCCVPDIYVNPMPDPELTELELTALVSLILEWRKRLPG